MDILTNYGSLSTGDIDFKNLMHWAAYLAIIKDSRHPKKLSFVGVLSNGLRVQHVPKKQCKGCGMRTGAPVVPAALITTIVTITAIAGIIPTIGISATIF